MSEGNLQSVLEKLNDKIRKSTSIKLVTLGILFLIFLIPMSMVTDLINERENRNLETTNEINGTWGNSQTLEGPILSLPYKTYLKDDKGKLIENISHIQLLPEELNMKGDISSEIRYRSIYKSVVYNSKINIKGYFSFLELKDLDIPEKDILWDRAFIIIGISDMRGIKDHIIVNWNNLKIPLKPGIMSNQIFSSGVSTLVAVNPLIQKYSFTYDIDLNGSNGLLFTPLGKETNLSLISKWLDPSFYGAFLPNKKEISGNGFNAAWKIINLNRNFPQKWINNAYKTDGSSFGVKLIIPINEYQKTMRSAKYGTIIVLLTFMIFFFVEIYLKKRIHPIQYILVAAGLCIFYVLLLSISEYSNFNFAYLISGTSVIILITLYSRYIFKNNIHTLLMGGCLSIAYIFFFILVQLQDYALLMGSVSLFLLLALIMFVSRKINWYEN